MVPEGDTRSSATSYRRLGGSIHKTPFRANFSPGGVYFWSRMQGTFSDEEAVTLTAISRLKMLLHGRGERSTRYVRSIAEHVA